MMSLFPSSDIGMFGRRQRHARGHRIPVAIVGGRIATRTDDTAALLDDFGLDEVQPLGVGCRCCTVRAKLQADLQRLLDERAQGRNFSRIAIETTQDLGPILRTFATERGLGAVCYVEDFPSAVLGGPAEATRRFALTEDAPLTWDAFSHFIATLTALRGQDVLRVRGVLNVQGCRGPVVVQFLQHLAHRPVELQAWPDEARTSRLDFVTRNIAEELVRDLFESVRTLAAPSHTQTSS